ncbi:helix-turn-helix domain-containing protein [Spongiimicrobium salis]|uniref:helix-turn-helix domain-containing protein n=1 Tax=Spongiimicrobium salis TaxID=1667022 RepID=UPI00374CA7B0
MEHFKTIESYCKAIRISAPKQPYLDIRSFEENMPMVIAKMTPFKHEFYAIAIKVEGSGKAISGHHTNFPKGATVFFNSPFQILSWSILPDWKGYYVMFSKEYVTRSKHLKELLEEFPFLKIDKAIPFEIQPGDVSQLLNIYENMYAEYHRIRDNSSPIIEAYLLVLLNYVKRFFRKQVPEEEAKIAFRKADVSLLSRFQTLIEVSFQEAQMIQDKVHSPSYYAAQLAVHPNHLNAVVKQVTGHTAKKHIHNHILHLAKSHLLQTPRSVKEIAYLLHFDSPNRFSSFFKKQTNQTPNSFRRQ